MEKSVELKHTSILVKEILTENARARNSDSYLYLMVLKYIGNRNGIDVDNMPVPELLLHMKQYDFPAFETVRRTRQKLQRSYPELAGCKAVADQRTENEEVFLEYVKG